jgi:thiamine biosynthesis protein ThiI
VYSVVVHYGELALKGRNRPWFVSMLVRTVKVALGGLDVQSVKPLIGRLVVTLGPQAEGQWDEIRSRLARLPGIGNFARATHVAPDLEVIAETVVRAVASEKAPRGRAQRA